MVIKNDKESVYSYASKGSSRHSKVSKASSASLLRRQEAVVKLAMLKAEMEHHDNVAEAQALVAKSTAELAKREK